MGRRKGPFGTHEARRWGRTRVDGGPTRGVGGGLATPVEVQNAYAQSPTSTRRRETRTTNPSRVPRKPSSIKVGAIGAYVIRGPDDAGRWYWQASAIVAGKRSTVWRGWATPAEAEVAIAGVRARLGDLEEPARRRADLTVATLLDRWFADLERRPWISPATIDRSRLTIRTLSRILGDTLVAIVSVEHTTGYMRRRQIENGVTDRTAHGELCLLRTAWRWGVAARLHTEPLHLPAVRLSKAHRPRPDRESAWRVYDALREAGGPLWIQRAYLLGLATGARTGEIIGVTVGDFDLDAAILQVRRGKTGARRVALGPEAVEMLRPHVQGREPSEVYVGTGTRPSFGRHLGAAIRNACRDVGVIEYPFYGLRRLAVDEYHRAGCPAAVAGQQMGHTAEVATRIYR